MKIHIRVLAIILFVLSLCSFALAQGLEDLKGVQLQDGSVIYGKVIETNTNNVIIEKKNGSRVSVKFNDVAQFLKDEQTVVAAKQEKSVSPTQRTGLYIGLGDNYAIENFDTSDLDDALGIHVDFGNSPGFNAKIGYHFNKLLSVEFNYDYFSKFSWRYTIIDTGIPNKVKLDVEVMTYMIAAKLSPYFGSEFIRPYITAGFGLMESKSKEKDSAPGVSASYSDSDSDSCGKIGVGIDFYVTKNVSIGFEGSYVTGFGDMDNISYTNLNMGVAYHF